MTVIDFHNKSKDFEYYQRIFNWIDSLPLMEDGREAVDEPDMTTLIFKREEDAIAFKLKFGYNIKSDIKNYG